jgi:hypothetical protein
VSDKSYGLSATQVMLGAKLENNEIILIILMFNNELKSTW